MRAIDFKQVGTGATKDWDSCGMLKSTFLEQCVTQCPKSFGTGVVDYELFGQSQCVYLHWLLFDSYLSKGHKTLDTCTFPEVFLTLGAPGDNLVIPLSPLPGRPLSVNLNLVPKEDAKSRHSSPSHGSPRKGCSRPSSPNPRPTRETHPETSCPHELGKLASSPISPDEDCFSLIERVHTAQLQKGMAQGEHKCKGEQGKGKGGGKKDKKNGGNKQ